jgi:hypothetical protein
VTDDDRDPAGRSRRTERNPTALNSADPVRNFNLTVDQRIRALTIGVPSWAARKRRIEDAEAHNVAELIELHDKLVQQGRHSDVIERALLSAANAFDLKKLNELVRTHNRYYPIEANLPMDRKTGSYLVYGRVWTPESPYSPTRFLRLALAVIERRQCGEADLAL